MNDIERMRQMREDVAWRERDKAVRELAVAIVAALPKMMPWTDRFCAMMLALLGCGDTLEYRREDIIAALTLLAGNVKQLEIDGLKELLGDG